MVTKTKKGNARTARGKKADQEEVIVLEEVEVMDDESMEDDVYSNPGLLQDVTAADLEVVGHQASKQLQTVQNFLPEELRDVDLRQRVIDLRKNVEASCWEMAKILYYIKVNESFRDWGFDNFTKYLESEDLGDNRRAQYLVELEEWFRDMKDKAKVEALKLLGWSKAKEVKRALNNIKDEKAKEEKITEWMGIASELSLEKLKRTVQVNSNSKSKDGDKDKDIEIDTSIAWNTRLTPDQSELVDQAMKLAEKETGSNVKGNLLTLICQSYIMDADVGEDFQKSREKWLPKIEERLKVKLVAVDNLNGEVIYGKDLLDAE